MDNGSNTLNMARNNDTKSKHSSFKNDLLVIKQVLPFLKLVLKHHIVILVISSFITIIGFITPFHPKLIIDQGVPNKNMGVVVSAILLGLIIQTFTIFSGWFTTLYRNQINNFIRYISTSDILIKLSNISPKYTSSMRTGDIVSRLNGLESGVSFIYSSIETIVRSILQLITLPALLLAMDYRILLFGLPSVAVTIIVWLVAQKQIKNFKQNRLNHQRPLLPVFTM